MSHKYQVLLSLIPTAICSYLFPRVFFGQNKNDLKLGDAYLKYYELFFLYSSSSINKLASIR